MNDDELTLTLLRKIETMENRIEYLEATEYGGKWTDYTATSTITGWSATTVEEIYYKRIGNLIFVAFDIVGTSNSATTNFTLPFTCTNDPSGANVFKTAIVAEDNGSWDIGKCEVSRNTTTVHFYLSAGAAINGWTASGDKAIRGEFYYEAQ